MSPTERGAGQGVRPRQNFDRALKLGLNVGLNVGLYLGLCLTLGACAPGGVGDIGGDIGASLRSVFPGAAPAASAAAPTPLTFDKSRADLDLTQPDGRACKAVADGGMLSNAALMGQVALTLGAQGFAESLKTNTDLQPKLDKIRPEMRELSKRVVWLPQASEVLIGEQLFRLAPRPDYRPVSAAQKRLVAEVMQPIFQALQTYATDELKTPLRFRLRLFVDDAQQSPEMVPGGTLLVPSGMVKTLAGSGRNPEQVVAFTFAHEFSHALRRHLTKSTQTRLVDGLLMADVFKQSFVGWPKSLDATNGLGQVFDLSGKSVDAAIAAVCNADKWFTAFDQKQELEADVCGALLLSKLPNRAAAGANSPTTAPASAARYDALEGLRQYRQIMAAMPPPTPEAKRLCVARATHPDPAQRESNLAGYQASLVRAP